VNASAGHSFPPREIGPPRKIGWKSGGAFEKFFEGH